ncbi:DUF47 domain-containing protein [Fervidobacterium thailandense]|uniref:TIGR00153 family protein n=1 Tax=Fervidobacterium thailandense TaxID=1008305 RepID=A0A1E3G1N7_9BACT|nr:DUF47 family protein [Fervidobacterium thailandense]ODN30166.1 hypothetical protein A4H02_07005 [Fervidobacterium thailandense]
MPFTFAKREREVIKNLVALTKKSIEAPQTLREFFDCYFDGNCGEFESLFDRIKEVERSADELRRGIISEIYKGLFLPDIREVIHSLTESIDKVVNKCESVSKIVRFQKPKIPVQFRTGIISQIECAIEASVAFSKSVELLFENIDEVHHYVLEVERYEHEEDLVENQLLEEIFKMDLPLAEKLQLKELVINIGDIVDRTEDASDILEVLLLKLSY